MITIIAAIAKNGVIGKNGVIPWHFSKDLQNFKRLTRGNIVIMGRKTFESIGKPLPNRTNIVVSSTLKTVPGIIIRSSFQGALHLAQKVGREIFIIGGASLYELAIPLADRMILTHIPQDYEGDTFFPKINKANWKLLFTEKCPQFEINTYGRV